MYFIFTWEMLCEEVRWVDLPTDFPNSNRSLPNFLPYPQTMRLEMAQFAKAGSRRDPYGGAGVRPHADGHLEPHVSQETLVAEPCPCGLHEAVELRLAG